MAGQLEIASVIAGGSGLEPGEDLPSMQELSVVAAAWMEDDDSRVDVNTLINALGVATGEHLRRRCDLSWVIAVDETGSDLALHGEVGDVLIYPANAVSKRIVDGDSDLAGFAEALVSEVLAIGER